MRAPATRPRVFLSSTIYDFADLRSSLKFWLEELGYEVSASEYNDFQKDLDLNSYEACLKVIDSSDYFILFVGSRAGGWFDEVTKTTITMHEYRRAYERAKVGSMKIATFVRDAVWNTREDRKGLAAIVGDDFAKEHGISAADVERITKHRSRVVEDAGTVFKFLSEIARNTEMKAATRGTGALPPANWIHRFNGFRDVVDALREDFAGNHGLRRVALGANLRAELIENLRHLLQRTRDGQCAPAYNWASFARRAFTGGPLEESKIAGNHLMWLALFAWTARASKRLSGHALNEAIISGEFLEFDRGHNQYHLGIFQQALIQLRDEIDRLAREESALTFEERNWMLQKFRPLKGDKETTTVPNERLVGAMSLHDRHKNTTSLARAILRALDGSDFETPVLHAGTPFDDEAKQIESETPSGEDVLGWVRT
jgi:uncharacterized protein DUF4062